MLEIPEVRAIAARIATIPRSCPSFAPCLPSLHPRRLAVCWESIIETRPVFLLDGQLCLPRYFETRYSCARDRASKPGHRCFAIRILVNRDSNLRPRCLRYPDSPRNSSFSGYPPREIFGNRISFSGSLVNYPREVRVKFGTRKTSMHRFRWQSRGYS